MRERFVGMALVNLATLVWATNMVLGRWLRVAIGPISLAAGRFIVATSILLVLLYRMPPEERRLRRDIKALVGMALTGVVIFMPTLYWGLRYTTAVNATLINGTGPLITGVLAGLFLKEPMSPYQVQGAVLGLVGVGWLISGGSLAFWSGFTINLGDVLVLFSVTLWSVYSIIGRRAMQYRSVLSVTAFSALLGLPFLLAGAFWEARYIPVTWSWQVLLAVVYIGVFPTVVGFLAWNEGVRRLGPSGAMVFYNMLPVYGALLGALLLHEPLGMTHLIGGLLIIGAGFWAGRK